MSITPASFQCDRSTFVLSSPSAILHTAIIKKSAHDNKRDRFQESSGSIANINADNINVDNINADNINADNADNADINAENDDNDDINADDINNIFNWDY